MSKTDEIFGRFENVVNDIEREYPLIMNTTYYRSKLEHTNHNLKNHLKGKGLLNSHWNSCRGRMYKESLRLLESNDLPIEINELDFSEEKEDIRLLLKTQEELEVKMRDIAKIKEFYLKEILEGIEPLKGDITSLYGQVKELFKKDDEELFRCFLANDVRTDFEVAQKRYNELLDLIESTRELF